LYLNPPTKMVRAGGGWYICKLILPVLAMSLSVQEIMHIGVTVLKNSSPYL
jgi:hypothetical protein